jgi:serine/threonine protein kinase
MHEQGQCHLDVNKQQFVLRLKNEAVTDFGSARQRGTILPNPEGTLIVYTAPEQLDKQQASPSMDCSSLGMTLGELFYRTDFTELSQETLDGLPKTNEAHIIKGLLDPNPNTRWTAEQAEQEFAKLLQS